jgi:predicted dehydrogenase
MDYVHSGKLGNISLVKTWIYSRGSNPLPVIPDEPVPAGVDFDMWLGPAPQRSFNRNRFHGSWRYFWDYGGGLMTDWGVHLLDIAFYGMNAPLAKSAIGTGGMFAFPQTSMETPDTQQTVYEFDKFNVIWEHGMGVTGHMYGTGHHGIAFIGSEGTLVVDREKWEVLPEIKDGQYLLPKVPAQPGNYDGLKDHVGNFLDCMKTRNKPNADIEIGRNVAINAHMGNIALRTGRKVYWEESNNQFQNDAEANALVKPNYRGPWKLPLV